MNKGVLAFKIVKLFDSCEHLRGFATYLAHHGLSISKLGDFEDKEIGAVVRCHACKMSLRI